MESEESQIKKPDVREERIRAITKRYYSQPKVEKALVDFASHREVVPRYFEGFGKRPDMIQYPSDIMGLANKGATSLHCSEEHWTDPLQLSSEITTEEMNALRAGWDLLIDIDSPFLDCSKIAAKLLIEALEYHGIKNYGIKFSGSKGLHIIVSWRAFPQIYEGKRTAEMFPAWPRAISSYLMSLIRKGYNEKVGKEFSVGEITSRTSLTEEDLKSMQCTKCGSSVTKGKIVKFKCSVCGMEAERRDYKVTKRQLNCLDNKCPGNLEVVHEEEYEFCPICKDPEHPNIPLRADRYPEYFEKTRGINAEKIAALDLVLVAPRHLFRMPYSLHEKTALASVVLKKEEIDKFSPRDADPMKVEIREFMPENEREEATKLLERALQWQREHDEMSSKRDEQKYSQMKMKGEGFGEIKREEIKDSMFPGPIKKLLKGLADGKKRGLFVLLTFLKSINYSPEEIAKIVKEWNEKNTPPLREGYIKSQLDWLFRQTKKILPPNYSNKNYYADLGILDGKMDTKNPVGDVARAVRKGKREF